MKCAYLGGAMLASLPLTSLSLAVSGRPARAADSPAIRVEYVAPPAPECASADAFQRMIGANAAEASRARTEWRYSVRVERSGEGYVGTITAESGMRSLRASTCDAVVVDLARLIGGGEVAETAPTESPLPDVAIESTPPDAAPSLMAPRADATPSVDDVSRAPERHAKADWRIGLRAQAWNHGAAAYGVDHAQSYGAVAVASVELPWGIFHKTLFEGAAGAMDSSAPAEHLTYYVLDTQACLVDVAFGASGVSLLGCLRLAGAWFKAEGPYGPEPGGAFWPGAGGRLRWQSEGPLFLELHANGVYGTVSGPEVNSPGWLDVGATVGMRL
jgi:hypothetical protein